MTSSPNPAVPPRAAAGIIRLFATAEACNLILGDLAEEFSSVALESGGASARRWYWRQTLRTLPHLLVGALRAAPLLTAVAAIGGFLLRRLLARVPDLATFAILGRCDIYEHHFGLYRFLTSTALDIEHVCTFLLVGGFVAVVARKRAMAPAVLLAIFYTALALFGSTYAAIRSGDYVLLWRLSWYLTDSLAIVAGAAVIGSLGALRTSRPVRS